MNADSHYELPSGSNQSSSHPDQVLPPQPKITVERMERFLKEQAVNFDRLSLPSLIARFIKEHFQENRSEEEVKKALFDTLRTVNWQEEKVLKMIGYHPDTERNLIDFLMEEKMKAVEFTLEESCRRFVEENELGADPKFLEVLFIHILTNDPDAIIWSTEYGLDNVAFFYMALGLPCSDQFLKRCNEKKILYSLQDNLLVCYHSEQRNLIGECRVDAHKNSRTNSAGSSGSPVVNRASRLSPSVPSTTNERQIGSAQNRVVPNGAVARSGPSRENGGSSLAGSSGPVVAALPDVPDVSQSPAAPEVRSRLFSRLVKEESAIRSSAGNSEPASVNGTPPNPTRRNRTAPVPGGSNISSPVRNQPNGRPRNEEDAPATSSAVSGSAISPKTNNIEETSGNTKPTNGSSTDPAVRQFGLPRRPVEEDNEVRSTTGSSTPALRAEQRVQNKNSQSRGLPSTSGAVPPVPQLPGAPKLVLRLPRRPVEEDTDARTAATVNRTPNVMISPNPTIRTGTAPVPASMSNPSPSHNRQNGNSLNRGLPDVSVASQSSGSSEIRSGLPVEAISTAKKPAESSTPASRTEQRVPATVNGSPPVTTSPNPTGRNETAPGAAEPAVNKKQGLNLEASSPQEEKRIRAWRPSGYQLSPAAVNGTPNLARRNRTLPVRSQPSGSPQNGGGASGTLSKSSETTASTSKSNGVNEALRSVEPVVYNFGNYQQKWDGKEKPKPPVSRQEAMKSSPILSNEESRTVSEASPLTIDSEHQNGGGAPGTSSKSFEPTTSSSGHASTSKSNGVNEAPRSVEPVVYHFGNYQQQFDNTEINPEPEPEQDLPRLSLLQTDNIEISSTDSSDSPMDQADDARGSDARNIPSSSSSRKRHNVDSSPAFTVPNLPPKKSNPLKRPAEENSGDRNSSLPSRGAGKRKVIKPREFTPYEDRKGKYETGERSMEGMLDKLRESSVSISRGSSPDSKAPVEPVSGPPPAKRGRGRPPGKKQRQVLRIIRIAESFFIIFRPPTAPIPPAPQEEQREPSEDSTQPSSSVTPATAEGVIAVTDLGKVRERRRRKPKIAPAPPVEVEDPKNEHPSPTLAVLKMPEPSTSTSRVLSPDSQLPVEPATPMSPATQEEPRELSEDICMPYSRTVTLTTADNLFPQNLTMYGNFSRVVVAATDRALGKTPADKKRGRQPTIAQVDVSPRNPVLADDPLNRPSTSTAESIVSLQGATPILPNEESRPSPLLIDSDDMASALNPGHSSNPEPVPEPELPRLSPSQNENNPTGSSDSPDEQEQPAGDELGSETQSIPGPSSPPTFAVPTVPPNRSNPLKQPAEEDSKDTKSPKLTEPSASTSHGLEPVSGSPAGKNPAPPAGIVISPAPQEEHRESSEDISMPPSSSVTPATARNRALEKARAAKVAKKDGKKGRKPKITPAPPVEVEDPRNRPSVSTAEPNVSLQGAKKPSPILPNEKSRPSPLLIDSDDIAPAQNPEHFSNPEPILEPELPRTSSPSIETSPVESSDSILEQEESADDVTGSEAQNIPSSSRKRKHEDPSPTLAVPKLPKPSTSTSHELSPDSQLPVGPATPMSPAPQEESREPSEDICMYSRSGTLATVDHFSPHKLGRQPKISQVVVSPQNPVLVDNPLDRPSTSSSYAEPIVRIDSHREERDLALSDIYKIFGKEEQESDNNETAKIETPKAPKAPKTSRRTSAPKDVSEDLVTFLQKMTQIVIQPIPVEVLAGLYWVQTPNGKEEEMQEIQTNIQQILNYMFNLDMDASTKALILYMTQASVPKRLLAQICKEVKITLHLDHESKIFQCQTNSISFTRDVNVKLEEWDATEMKEMMTFILTVAQANQQLTLNDIFKMYQESEMNWKKRAAEDVRIKVISCVTCATPTTYDFINIAASLIINFKIPVMDEVKEVILSGGEFQLDDKGYMCFYKREQFVAGQVNDMMTNPVIKKNLENLKGLMKAFHDGMEAANLEFLKDLMEEVNVRMEKLVGEETIKIMEVRQSLYDVVRMIRREAFEESTDDNSICVAKVLRILLATANVLTGSLAKEVQVTVQKVVKDYEVHPEKIPQEMVIRALRVVMNLQNE
ncbi:hypothetical protein CRE_23742 [Caenorhabditis remanei]|uniref:SPK domain-containing protein n=1 Tax=Caenorhabditis remanei TaxID=31234 RepID=E3NFV6_CAERE|nr:hypothetical protein CRE_23742 [Caenorhabditis remanei]